MLTGYERIPRNMPDVRSSRVIERREGVAAVELTAKSPERVVRYELAAKPSFDVPEFLLQRLLKRDPQVMPPQVHRREHLSLIGSQRKHALCNHGVA